MKTIQTVVCPYIHKVESTINELIEKEWRVVSMVADPQSSRIVFLLEKYVPEQSEGYDIGNGRQRLPSQ